MVDCIERNKNMKIAVIGLGYVGLPLSFQFARSGVTVLGLDIDTAKVEALTKGKSYIKHIPAEAVAEVLKSGGFSSRPSIGPSHKYRSTA